MPWTDIGMVFGTGIGMGPGPGGGSGGEGRAAEGGNYLAEGGPGGGGNSFSCVLGEGRRQELLRTDAGLRR